MLHLMVDMMRRRQNCHDDPWNVINHSSFLSACLFVGRFRWDDPNLETRDKKERRLNAVFGSSACNVMTCAFT